MKFSLEQRIAGILIPVFALRSADDLGIGDTGSLRRFIDFAAEHGFRLVKILPINETGNDHSPYNAISSIALEPATLRISPDAIRDLTPRDLDEETASVDDKVLRGQVVEYSLIKPLKRRLLERAFTSFQRKHTGRRTPRGREFAQFCMVEASWLDDYALFRLLMEENGGRETWDQWREEHRSIAAARRWLRSLPERRALSARRKLRYFKYVQWIAFTQWREVKAYAGSRDVALMGDIPFGVSYYSADVFSQPDVFKLRWSGGTPPDKIFKHDPFVQKWGQNWGIPLYDWDAMRADGFRWWRQRVRGVREFFDLFRIDHVLGFYRIYGFPWRPEENAAFLPLSESDARDRTGGPMPGFKPRPDASADERQLNRSEGEEYLRVIVEEAGEGSVVGEDLGEVPDYVRPNLTSLGIAGYKIPMWEKRPDGALVRGGEYERLSLATYGTHDHEPLKAMWERLTNEAREQGTEGGAAHEMRLLCEYAGWTGAPPESFTPELHEALLKALFCGNSWIAVAMVTDLFARAERFNFPGTASGQNWTQRLHAPIEELGREPVLGRIEALLRECGRV